jgi:probable rRNA maturation factor
MPEPLVGVVIEDPRWADAGLEAIAERAGRAALAAAGRDPDRHEISLLGCGDARIAELNASFRDRAAPTNVLSWPAFEADIPEPDGEEPLFLGDIALAYDTCRAEAEAAGIGLGDHTAHLVVHGVLHLLGLDHVAEDEAEAMEALETNILASMGIANPYSR